MAGLMDLLRMSGGGGGMPQRPQGGGMGMPPQGGFNSAMPPPPMGGMMGGMMDALNRPAVPDIMSLIKMLTSGSMGMLGGASGLPPLEMLGGAPEIAGMMQPEPKRARPIGNGPNEPEGPGGPAQEQRLKDAEKPKGKAGTVKKKKSPKEKMASDMIAADRVGAGDFVRK